MLKLRREQMEAFRPLVRAQTPHRILTDLQKQGVRAERDTASGDIVAIDGRGFRSRLSFSQDGLPVRVIQPSGATHHFQHDEQGRLAALTYPGGERLEIGRDDRGNVTELRRPGLLSYGLEYDDNDRLLAAHHPDGSASRLTYHPEGPLDSITDRTGATTRYNRNQDGRLRSIVDPLGRETVYRTGAEGRLEAVVFPDGTSEEYTFDPEAKALEIKKRDGGIVLQELDDKGRVKAITWSDRTRTEFAFDEAGHLAVARNEAGEIVHTFDASGNPLSETTRDGTVTYEYDAEGRLTRLTNPFGDVVEYEYDGDGRLAVARDWDGRETRFVHAPDGTIAEIHYGNGLIEKQEHARVGRLQHARVVDRRGRLLSEQVYEYDLNERLTGYADLWGEASSQRSARRFEYDGESRLTTEIDADSKRALARYEYDSKGNLISDNGTPVEVGSLDEPVRYGGATIEYDANGHMKRLPGPRGDILCEFGADGTLRQANLGTRTIRFEYDALGRRISKTDGVSTWRFGWAGFQLIWEEYQASPQSQAVRREYLYLPDDCVPLQMREGGTPFWFQVDSRRAVIRCFSLEGTVAWRGVYESHGGVRSEANQINQPWRLEGQYHDEETGLHYNFNRYYSPWLKVYLSRDPCWGEPAARNYAYASGDPWNKVDPFGNFWHVLGGLALGAIIGAGVALITGGDPVAGAVEGAIFAAGLMLGGPVLGGIIGSGVGAFAGSLVEQARRGEELCFECAALQGVLAAALYGALLLGGSLLARIPAVRRLAGWAAKQLGKVGPAIERVLAKIGLRSSYTVSAQEAEEILIRNGMSRERARDFVNSFEGPIRVRTVQPGETFYRYSNREQGAGNFLTGERFSTPSDAVEGLYLRPYNNEATFRQAVVATEETIVLEGGVRNGTPGVGQTLITDQGRFNFGTGERY